MSSLYSLKESTLTALADIVRDHIIEPIPEDSLYLYVEKLTLKAMDYTYYEIPDAKKLRVVITPVVFGNSGNGMKTISLGLKQGKPNTWNDYETLIRSDDPNNLPYETIIEGSILGLYGVHTGVNNNITINIELFGLDENGNEYDFSYTPLEAIDIINNTIAYLKTVSIPEEAFTIKKDMRYMFSEDRLSWFINNFGEKIKTEDITCLTQTFGSMTTIKQVPFEINIDNSNSMDGNIFQYTFYKSSLEYAPQLNFKNQDKNSKHVNMSQMFADCYYLKEIPEWFGKFLELDVNLGTSNTQFAPYQNIFLSCYSLRKIPEKVMKYMYNPSPTGNYYTVAYSTPFRDCIALDELINIPVDNFALTSNQFSSFFTGLCSVKDITFATQEDGTPYKVGWQNQKINLASSVGYTPTGYKSRLLNYNSGITADKEVKDDATYQALKDDPDWFSTLVAYSKYNHRSAVNTINSLPDVSSGSGNTITFYKSGGLNTDEGPCGNLTEEEIAVATAKGWTVSLS